MTHRATCVALLALSLAGCGTAANLAGPDCGRGTVTPFGGVQYDREAIQAADARPARLLTAWPWGAALPPALYALDLPFSFAADVLTWPYTTIYTRLNAPVTYPPIVITPPSAMPATQPGAGPPATTPPAAPVPLVPKPDAPMPAPPAIGLPKPPPS